MANRGLTIVCGALAVVGLAWAGKAGSVPPRNRRPYAGIDWKTAVQVKTTSHAHCSTLEGVKLMTGRGFEFMTLSNYHPSMPHCPLAGLSDGVLEAPNAEHWGFIDPKSGLAMDDVHMCAPGSSCSSGEKFDLPWNLAIGKLVAGLVFPEGGGVTINHPRWSHIPYETVNRLLDVDPRVLGIEVYNCSCGNREAWPWSDSWSEDYWDHALATGRQCFGFSVPDWDIDRAGVNVLVVPEKTVRACLAAYRRGDFYCAVLGTVAKFTLIAFDGRTFAAATDVPCAFELVSRKGVVGTATGTSFSWRLPDRTETEHVFLRLRARPEANGDELLFTQPQMLTDREG